MKKLFTTFSFLLLSLSSVAQLPVPKDTLIFTSLNIQSDGLLYWSTKNEASKSPFIIEQFRWNKWIKLGNVDPVGTTNKNNYSFQTVPHSGKNIFRVKQFSEDYASKELKWNSNEPKVSFKVRKKSLEISFSSDTHYEIFDSTQKLQKKGYGGSVSIESLPKGIYTLNYDNFTHAFERE